MLTPGLDVQQLHAVLDAVSDAVFLVDRHFSITCMNRAAEQFTGFQRSEVIGRRCYDVLRSPECHNDCLMARTMRTGETLSGRTTIRTRDNECTAVDMRMTALRGADGSIIGGVNALRPREIATLATATAGDGSAARMPILAVSERAAIEAVLERHGWNQVVAARVLGISRTTLWRKMRKLGIQARPRATP